MARCRLDDPAIRQKGQGGTKHVGNRMKRPLARRRQITRRWLFLGVAVTAIVLLSLPISPFSGPISYAVAGAFLILILVWQWAIHRFGESFKDPEAPPEQPDSRTRPNKRAVGYAKAFGWISTDIVDVIVRALFGR